MLCTIFPPTSADLPIEFIDQILDVTLHELSFPEKSKAIPATAVISWTITSGASYQHVASRAINRTIALFLEVWKQNTSETEDQVRRRASLLGHLVNVLGSVAKLAVDQTQVVQTVSRETTDELLGILMAASLQPSLSQTGTSLVVSGAIQALVKMAEVPGLLGLEETRNVVDTATRVLMSGMDCETWYAVQGLVPVTSQTLIFPPRLCVTQHLVMLRLGR